ncbi:MAG: HTH-type transcriptional regulator ImmR [Firmicutes bacterium ADurb.Bin354]|nr:MAG: HTH-type transcriptional regulator ImmR [Firmicutes bacterium ADurb.Bin354]SCY37482.1 Transcriptional regulator, contains XRE-family HTH domain [Lachnospiraceae bacterium XPB1003]
MNIAQKLTYLRDKKGCSQEDVADALGVSRQTVSKWELGNAVPDTSKIVDLSTWYNVSTDYLLKDEFEGDGSGRVDRVVIKFMNSARAMNEMSDDLIEIARDGVISPEERVRLKEMSKMLEQVQNSVDELRNIIES